MKATVSFNGKKYIYKLDGKQIRTSTKSYAYEFVAVLTYGDYREVRAMGNAKTCNAEVSKREIGIAVYKSEIAYLKGEISYKQYVHNVGFAHAYIKSAFAEMLAEKGEQCIKDKEENLKRLMNTKIEVIKIENEF